VPTYRIYYAEREVRERRIGDQMSAIPHGLTYRPADYLDETEWEEEVEADDAPAALEAFFAAHVANRSDVMWVDSNVNTHPIERTGDWQPAKTYIWTENGKLMEYQGLDQVTHGLVSCPLCAGAGEVRVEVADEYLAAYGEQIAERE
jgi:hypothetical protein